MKSVKLDRKVADTSGLFFDLIRGDFEVVSVAAEESATYVHLEDEEEKDPLPVVEMWADKAVAPPSKVVVVDRRKIYDKYVAEKPSRMEAIRARLAARLEISVPAFSDSEIQPASAEPPIQMLSIEPKPKEGWLKKLAKLW